MTQTITCSRCGEDKPPTQFPKGRRQCRPCRKSIQRAYYEANRPRILRQVRAYAEAHQGERREWGRQWRERNDRTREKHDYYMQNRTRILEGYHASRGARGFFSWEACLEIYGGQCAHCGSSEYLEVDHIVPLSRGGTNWQFNIQPLCQSCNKRKFVRPDWEVSA